MKKIELFGGILTFMVALFVTITVLVPLSGFGAVDLVLYLGSALLILIGACFHVFRRRTLGLLILLLSGFILVAFLVIATLGRALGYFYVSRGPLVLAPVPFAVITMIAALFVRLKGTGD